MNIIKCNSFWCKLKGLMFKKNINVIMVFKKCNSIHTFFMREPIDVVMTDINGDVLFTYKSLKPWKVILPKKRVYYTFEFPDKYLLNNNVKDIIKESLF